MTDGEKSHTALVMIQKNSVGFKIKWDFGQSLGDAKNTSCQSLETDEKEAIRKFVRNQLNWHEKIEFLLITQIKM